MASDFEIGQAAAKAMCDALADMPDAGASAGYIQVRTGVQPANCAAANTGTLLATLPLSDPAFGAATTADPSVATANSVTPDTVADASGVAGHLRVFDSNNVCHMQFTAGEAADSPDAVFDDKDIVAGGTVSITSFTITQPLS